MTEITIDSDIIIGSDDEFKCPKCGKDLESIYEEFLDNGTSDKARITKDWEIHGDYYGGKSYAFIVEITCDCGEKIEIEDATI